MHMILLICISTSIAAARVQSQTIDEDHYGIILDGGSSGTKLKVYRWRWTRTGSTRGRRGLDGLRIERRSIERDGTQFEIDLVLPAEKFEPGVSSFVFDLGTLKPYIEKIIQQAARMVPIEHHSTTPISFLATAGMRMFSYRETGAVLATIRQQLLNSSINPFLVQTDSIRVISGEEEAVFAWVATNFLRGSLMSDSPSSETVGVLEMGGGSTQIAFLPEHSVYANMFPVKLSGRTYHLYAHSYLFYGQNYIVQRINDFLCVNRSSLTEVANPCMLKGDNKTHMFLGQSVHIFGTADVAKCLNIIDHFLKTAEDNWCYPKPCAIARTYQPPVGDEVFFAVAAFRYAPEYLRAIDASDRLNVSLLRTRAETYCSKTYAEVVATGLEAQYGSEYCIMGLYIHSLLIDAYRFNETRNTVYALKKINGVDIDWTMGAMLLYVEDLEPNKPCEGAMCGVSSATKIRPLISAFYLLVLSVALWLNVKC